MERLVRELAVQHGFSTIEVVINSADDRSIESLYLTVTGTSADAGDDGQVGRGNRVNGLITPGRPMSLEAAAGKNSLTHVGKIYNVLAREISAALIVEVPNSAAQCLMVIRQQTAVINAIRAHLAEFGIVAPVGRKGVEQLLDVVADAGNKRLPELARAKGSPLSVGLALPHGADHGVFRERPLDLTEGASGHPAR